VKRRKTGSVISGIFKLGGYRKNQGGCQRAADKAIENKKILKIVKGYFNNYTKGRSVVHPHKNCLVAGLPPKKKWLRLHHWP